MMEYGLHISSIRALPGDPRTLCPGQWQEVLPPGPLRAVYFGSEFCEDLLPDVATVERFCLWAVAAGMEAVLLTPVVTPRGLSLVERLLEDISSRGCAPSVLFNDWGVLNLLRNANANFHKRAGRLMNRGLRDPRLSKSPAAGTEAVGRAGRLRSLLVGFGVEAVETDSDLEGMYLGDQVAGLQRVLHFPYVFAATGRNCLVKADGATSAEGCFTKGLGLSCTGLCRERWHQVNRQDTGNTLWRSGNTLFYEASPEGAKVHLAQSDRIVLYERPTA